MTSYHRQCKLKRGTENQVSWIPDAIAVVGQVVKLKEEDGTWDEGWEVIEIYDRSETQYVLKHSRDWKTQRRGSDI